MLYSVTSNSVSLVENVNLLYFYIFIFFLIASKCYFTHVDLFVLLFFGIGFLYCCLGTCFLDENGFELVAAPASATTVLGLKVFATTSGSHMDF